MAMIHAVAIEWEAVAPSFQKAARKETQVRK